MKKTLQNFPREVLLDFRLQNSEESQSCLRFECMWFTLWALLVLLLVMVHTTLCPRVCSVWKAAPLSGNHMWLEQPWARSKICLDRETCVTSVSAQDWDMSHLLQIGHGEWNSFSHFLWSWGLEKTKPSKGNCSAAHRGNILSPLLSLAARHWSWLKPRAHWYRPSSPPPS